MIKKPLLISTAIICSFVYSLKANVAAANMPETSYTDKETGLTFSYPSAATVEQKPDQDTIVRFTVTYPRTNEFYVFTINRMELSEGSDPAAAVHVLDENMFPHLKNYRSLNNERKWIGKRSQFDADIRTIAHELDGKRVCQKWVVLNDRQANNRLDVMTFVAPEQNAAQLDRFMNGLLSTLDHPADRTSSTSALPLKRATFEGISLAYPGEWKAQSYPEKDTLLKAQGGNMELRLSAFPAELNISPDQMQKLAEEEILSKMPRYKKISDTSRKYGAAAGGVKEMFTGEIDGLPAFGQAFFFPYNNKIYCLIMMSWGMDQSEAVKRFDSIAGSLIMH